jgi:hypothetical protein
MGTVSVAQLGPQWGDVAGMYYIRMDFKDGEKDRYTVWTGDRFMDLEVDTPIQLFTDLAHATFIADGVKKFGERKT